jgi:hypothetical protein
MLNNIILRSFEKMHFHKFSKIALENKLVYNSLIKEKKRIDSYYELLKKSTEQINPCLIDKKILGSPVYLLRIESDRRAKYSNPITPVQEERNKFYELDEKIHLDYTKLMDKANEYMGLFTVTDKGYLIEGFLENLIQKEGKASFIINDNYDFLLFPYLKETIEQLYYPVYNRFKIQSAGHGVILPADLIQIQTIEHSNDPKRRRIYKFLHFNPDYDWFDESKIRMNGITNG